MPNENTNSSYYYPKGWLIKAFRNLRFPHKDYWNVMNGFEDLYSDQRNRREDQNESGTPVFGSRDVAYGNYDRIQITPVEHLYDFTRVANQTHDWLGSNQSILLYKWKDDDKKRCFRARKKEDSKKTRIVVLDENGKPREKEFSAVTFCYISDSVRSCTESSYENLLDRCENNICGLVDAFNLRIGKLPEDSVHQKVSAEVFGSLSAAELVILWSAKQYTDVMYLIDCVRDFECHWEDEKSKLFRTTYTLITSPDVVSRDYKIKCWEDMRKNSEKLNEVQGEAQLMFATQDGAGEKTFQDFKKFFGQCIKNASAMLGEDVVETLGEKPEEKYPITPCAGEYDLLVNVPSKYVTRLFCNPQTWHDEQDSEWMNNPTEQDAACSVFHPSFHKYILYSFTRLTYKKNRDLPAFVQDQEPEWENDRKKWCCIKDVNLQKASQLNRTIPTTVFKTDHDLLDELLKTVRVRIPLNSNLSMELNQLFNDYAQCMCASADGLWISDYRELYRQILEQLCGIIQQMDDRERGDWDERGDTDNGTVIEDINRLIRSLHKQTNHISTSSKQLFREQETHFGYTAQHDLVLHAYYDMVKHLIQVIYSYSDQSFQSPLYPLVDFRAGDYIKSNIYFEEGAEYYLKTGCILPARVIVIDLPLDGMDNLMYYIPMMVHEVFHYASPRDRRARNQMLTKISVYLALNYSLTGVFNELFQAQLEDKEKEKSQSKRRTSELLRSVLRKAEECFRNAVMDILCSFVEKHLAEMYQSLESTFFTAELESMSKTGHNNLEESLNLKELQEGIILRSWFVIWLENWLCAGNEAVGDDEKPTERRMLSDFFEPLLQMLSEELTKAKTDDLTIVFRDNPSDIDVYKDVIVKAFLNSADGVSSSKEAIKQRMVMWVQDYTVSDRFSRFRDLIRQLDEIFPDIAMATLTDMPASGYMLQIALDLDRKMRSYDNITMNDIRFAAVLNWLVNRQSEKTGKNTSECLELELKSFQRLYRSSYKIIAFTSSSKNKDKDENEDAGFSDRADRWSSEFQKVYDRYSKTAPTRGMMGWIDTLIEDELLPCLQMKEETEENKRIKANMERLFQEPYNAYLELLRKKDVGAEMLGELFRLSIKTIMQFQRHQTLKQMNKEFQGKPAKARTIDERKDQPVSKSRNRYQDDYTDTLTVAENLLMVVQHAVDRLYSYRKTEGLNTPVGMWYRGVSNASNNVLPSGFVHFAEDAGKLNGRVDSTPAYTYLKAQRHNYETFRYSAEGSGPDVSPAQYHCTMNYLTLMQHYGQHTNLMDWSEDFFAATYFALEEQIKLNDDYRHVREKKIKDGLKDADEYAALYILDPIRFNRACQKIEQEIDGLFDLSKVENIPGGDEILNLSILENQERMREYHELYQTSPLITPKILKLHNPDGKTDKHITLTDIKNNIQYNRKDSVKPSGRLPMHLPRAVYAAKLNARIRAQSGLFIAYSLLSPPVVWEKDAEEDTIDTDKLNPWLFNYQCLKQIQDYYLQMDGRNRPFLMKIKLPSYKKIEWGKLFYRFGLSTERIYPELQNNRNR